MASADAERAQAVAVDLLEHGWSETRDDEHVHLIVWVPARDADAAAEAVHTALAAAGVEAHVRAAPEGDEWRDGLRRHHRPIEVGGVLRVRPPWLEPVDGRMDVVIDPGMAFGTGQHATTRGCLACLLSVTPGGLVDVGCGSGVLSVAARRLGHDPVIAIDHDPLSVEATLRNAAANGVTVDARLADATTATLPEADTIVANITRMHVIRLAARVATPPRTAVLSGFIIDDVPSATLPWRELGMRVAREVHEDGWAAVRLERT